MAWDAVGYPGRGEESPSSPESPSSRVIGKPKACDHGLTWMAGIGISGDRKTQTVSPGAECQGSRDIAEIGRITPRLDRDTGSAAETHVKLGCLGTLRSHLLDRLDQVCQAAFGVAIEHAGDGFEEERIFQTGKALAFAALEHHHGLCLIDFYDGHTGD